MLSLESCGKEMNSTESYSMVYFIYRLMTLKGIIIIVANTYIELAVCDLVFLAILIH